MDKIYIGGSESLPQVHYISWSSAFALIPIVLSSVGILLTLLTLSVLVRNRETPLVRASGASTNCQGLCKAVQILCTLG